MPAARFLPRSNSPGTRSHGVWEEEMKGMSHPGRPVRACLIATCCLIASAMPAQGQEIRGAASHGSASAESTPPPDEVRALTELIRSLQDQVQTLNTQVSDLRKEQERASAEER